MRKMSAISSAALSLLGWCVLPAASAQTLNIGPGGVSFSSGNTQNDVTLRLDHSGLKVGTATPSAAPPPRLTPVPAGRAPASRLSCAGRAMNIRGSNQQVTLTGRCPQVTVSGSGNVVNIEQVDRITVTGSRNSVVWSKAIRGAKPSTFVSGSGNQVAASGSAAARAAPKIQHIRIVTAP